MVENNIVYVWEMRRSKDGSVQLPLDTIRSKKTAWAGNLVSGSTSTIYSVPSNRIVQINQIIATDLSGTGTKNFSLSCMNLSGEVIITPKLGKTSAISGAMTTVYDNLNFTLASGSELVYSGQKIMVSTSGSEWYGNIGITVTEDSRIDE